MDMDFSTAAQLGLSALIFLVLGTLLTVSTLAPPHKRGFFSSKQWHMPPGPRGRPIFGSVLEWIQAKRTPGTMIAYLVEQSKYGEMTTLHMGTKTWVLLNSQRAATAMFAKHANVVHERPYFPIAGGLVSRDNRLFLQKTADWREGRRLIHGLMMGSGSKQHAALVEHETLGMLRAYLEAPRRWYIHNYRFTLSVMYKIVTGGQSMLKTDGELSILQNVTSTFLTSINSSLVEFFPQLTHLPKALQTWRPHWEEIGRFHRSVFHHWFTGMSNAMDESAPPSFVRDSVLKEYLGPREKAMYLTMLVMGAGSDNPRMTLNAFIMACLAAPDKMVRAREELDRICGTPDVNNRGLRLPDFQDHSAAPYMSAVVKEVLRWRPTVPLIPQRVLTHDLDFEGYRFPAGTEFLVNSVPVCWNGHKEPMTFAPERWLGPGAAGVEQDLWTYAFSEGRRMCVGYKLAQKETWVAFARLLYCFEIMPAGPFDPTKLNAFSTGEPFPATTKVRSPAHEALIREASSDMEITWEDKTTQPHARI